MFGHGARLRLMGTQAGKTLPALDMVDGAGN